MGKPAGIVVMDETENRSMEETAMTRKLLLPLLSLLLALCFAVPALADSDFVFDKTVTELFEGGTLETVLIRSGDAAEGDVSYTTSAPKVATVDENGVVTAIKSNYNYNPQYLEVVHNGITYKCQIRISN